LSDSKRSAQTSKLPLLPLRSLIPAAFVDGLKREK